MHERDVISWASLIVAYSKSGNMKAASELFDGLPLKDMVVWTTIVTGYAQNARPRESLENFERMQDAGVETDEVTLVGAISACAQLGAANYANWVRDIADKSGLAPTKNVVIGCSYLTTLGAASKLQEMSIIRDRIAHRLARSNGLILISDALPFNSFMEWWKLRWDKCRVEPNGFEICTMTVYVLWNLWLARNAIRFKNMKPSPLEVASKATVLAAEFQETVCKKLEPDHALELGLHVSKPPDPNLFKLNSDASWICTGKKGSWGCVIQNHAGEFIVACAAPIKHALSARLPEALAIREGLYD